MDQRQTEPDAVSGNGQTQPAAAEASPLWQLDVEPVEPTGDPGPVATPSEPPRRSRRDRPSVTPPPLLRILEAMLFVSDAPLTFARAAEVIRGLTPEQFEAEIAELNRRYRSQGRPYSIQDRQGGKMLLLRPRFRFVKDRLYGGPREARLSPAAIEVLSLVAYRQPITRAEIESLRGRDSMGPLRQLVRLGLVEAVRRTEGKSRAVCYATTPRFLELFGLSSLNDLPETDDLSRL
jgi:segregation and condensation protein B